MSSVLMQLGNFQFSASTAAYNQLQRQTEYRWAKQARIGRAPARQFVGPGDDSIDLEGVVYPGYKSGLNQIDDMRANAKKGEPLRMVAMPEINAGIDLGLWVVEHIEETQSHIRTGGTPGKQEFRLQLAAYGEDR